MGIEKKTLQIKSVVRIKDDYGLYKFAYVYSISKLGCKVRFYQFGKLIQKYFKYEDIEPIEITDELLSYLGFSKDDELPNMVFSNDKRVSFAKGYSNTLNCDYYLHIDNEDFATICGCDCKYLHIYQSLLNAVGYESDIFNEITKRDKDN